MKEINEPQIQDINGLFQSSKTIQNKIIVDNIKIDELNKNNFNKENKDNNSIKSPLIDKKIQNFKPSYIQINTLSDMSYNFNLNSNNALISSNEMKSDRNKQDSNKINSDEILENGLNLDEQNIVNYDEKFTNKVELIKKEQNDEFINNINNKMIKSSIEENKYMNNNNQDELIKIKSNQSLPFGIQIQKELFDQIEYAIDENGNPFNIKQNSEDTNNKKPVALIIQKEAKDQNYLIDLQGKKIPKMEDGYFSYKNNNLRVIIQDFDVQHPELRVYGTRNKNTLTLNEEEKMEEKGENNNNEIKNYSMVLNKKTLNFKRNSPIKIKNIKNINPPKSDNRIKYNINRNKKQIEYKRMVPKPNPPSTSQYLGQKYTNNYTINRTSNILNKSSSIISHHNRSYTKSYSKNDLINIKYDHFKLNNTDRNIISVTPSREIKNVSYTSSRINLFNYKRNKKKGGSFNNLNKVINLNNVIHRNSQSLKSLPSSCFEENNTNNGLISNKQSINTNYNSIQIKNFKKNQSSYDVSGTIDNISNKIKYIKNKINNTNKILTPTSTSTISTNNSQINNISKEYNNFNIYNNINKRDNNSSLHKRQFKCAILSKEVNDIISDYSTENKNKVLNSNPYAYENKLIIRNKNRETNINSFLNGHSMTNLMFKRNENNYSTEPNFLKTANLANLNNNILNKNKNIDNCRLCGRNLLNRMKYQTSNNILQNGIINFKRKKMNLLLNTNENKHNVYKHPIISESYKNNINLLNSKNKLNNKNKFSLIGSRNALLNLEENKSQTNGFDFFTNNRSNINKYNFNFNYSTSNTNNNSRNFDFS